MITCGRRAAALLAVGLLLQGCGAGPPTAGAAVPRIIGDAVAFEHAPVPPTIVAAPPQSAATRNLSLPGRLVWNENHTVRVFTPFSGRVIRILAQLGDRVARDAPLAELNSADYGTAQADYQKAVAAGHVAQRALERNRDLYARGVIARSELEQAEADAAAAAADVARSQRLLKTYDDSGGGVNGVLALRAPIGGVVVERNINPGQEVRADQSGAPQFVITDPGTLWIQLDAREADLPALRDGTRFEVHAAAYPDAHFTGRVIRVSDFVDPVSRTIKVLGLVDNAGHRLKGQMFVSATLTAPTGGQLQTTARAVLLLGDRHYVFVRRGNAFERREVTVGTEHDGRIAILSGIRSSDSLVTDGALYLETLLERGQGPA